MSNMSYCMFENTLSDLEDCKDALSNYALNLENLLDKSESEREATIALVRLCREIADEFEDDASIAEDNLNEWEDEQEEAE